jgi:alpha-L-fucosidase
MRSGRYRLSLSFLPAIFFQLWAVCAAKDMEAQLFTEKNIVFLNPSDQYADIIRKAAAIAPSPRQLKWQQLELTAFLHFGMNTFTNKEWGDGTEDPKLFNPERLDAYQWIRICKEAGMKQVILTAKHHDGFCLWPSKWTAHSVKNSPWKKGKGDVVKEVSDACRYYGLGFGIYLSPWDRNSSFFGDSALYNDYFVRQLSELLTNYGKITEVWFDGANGEGPAGKKQVYDFNRWYALIRKLQPDAVIAVMGPDVRWVGTETGYGRETEWSVVPADAQLPAHIADNSQKVTGFAPVNMMQNDLGSRAKILQAKSLVWYPAEMDVSIRPGWFYHPAEDPRVKTPAALMDIYFSSVGRNGALLLNIPPGKNGLIAEADQKSLQGWKALREKTFAVNDLKGAVIESGNGRNAGAMLDGDARTFWTTKAHDTAAVITFRLPHPQVADVLSLQEHIATGQRIEKFVVEYKHALHWERLTEGTTVGYKRLLRFPPVKIDWLRIRIISSRSNPTLSEVGLYKEAH